MGTRSITRIYDEKNKLICRIYRQFDGYIDGHGHELAKIADKKILNGYQSKDQAETCANGMGCLAATIVAKLKKEHPIGGIYLTANDEDEEYNYNVKYVNNAVYIECHDSDDKLIFRGTPKELMSFKEYVE